MNTNVFPLLIYVYVYVHVHNIYLYLYIECVQLPDQEKPINLGFWYDGPSSGSSYASGQHVDIFVSARLQDSIAVPLNLIN